jgi:hypothetical protein
MTSFTQQFNTVWPKNNVVPPQYNTVWPQNNVVPSQYNTVWPQHNMVPPQYNTVWPKNNMVPSQYIYNIRTLSVNIKFICTSFRNRQNSEP